MNKHESHKSRDRQDAFSAAMVAFLFHGCLLVLALILFLNDPIRKTTPITVAIIQRDEDEIPKPAGRAGRDVREPAPVWKTLPPETDTDAPVAGLESDAPPDTLVVLKEKSISVPKSPLDAAMTSEEAFAELNRLLEQHPEYRGLIFRELMAGDGTVRDWQPRLDIRLAELLKMEKWKSSWEYEMMKRGGGGYFGSYDPIHGFNRDQKVGLQVNIFELLKFLKSLIGK